MAFSCYFFRFAKKENSLKQPVISNALVTMDITLKESCSVVNPVILVNTADLSNKSVYNYNYCYIPHFKRYYYIDDWVYSSGLWAAFCHVDSLASWKNDIMQSSFFIMRSTYDSSGRVLYDGNVADGKYPTTAAAATYQSSAVNNPYSGVEGVYVVGIINSSSNNGAVTYYAFNKIGFNQFCSKLFNYSTGWLNIDVTEISEDLQKALVNPFQYVVSCMYLPLNVSDITAIGGTATTTIRFGWWSVTVANGARIVDTTFRTRKTISLSIPRHPAAPSRGNYLNLSPYSIYTLRFYPYGTLDIDTEAIASWNTLDLYSDVDICTGKGILNICVNGFNNPIRTVEALVGVQIPTASLQTNYMNIVTGKTAVAAAGAVAVGKLADKPVNAQNHTTGKREWKGIRNLWNDVKDYARNVVSDIGEMVPSATEIKETAADILNTAVAASTTAEIQGMQGMASAYNAQTLTLSGRFLPVATEDFTHTGRPLMQQRQISSLSGFAICKDADISATCTDRERRTIQGYLESGFFIE